MWHRNCATWSASPSYLYFGSIYFCNTFCPSRCNSRVVFYVVHSRNEYDTPLLREQEFLVICKSVYGIQMACFSSYFLLQQTESYVCPVNSETCTWYSLSWHSTSFVCVDHLPLLNDPGTLICDMAAKVLWMIDDTTALICNNFVTFL